MVYVGISTMHLKEPGEGEMKVFTTAKERNATYPTLNLWGCGHGISNTTCCRCCKIPYINIIILLQFF